jgi:hypothetical protein
MDFAWAAIKETSKNIDDPMIMDAFKRSTNDDTTKKQLMTFVSDAFII